LVSRRLHIAHSLARPTEDDTWGTRGQLTKGAVEVQVAGEFESIAIQTLTKHSKPASLQKCGTRRSLELSMRSVQLRPVSLLNFENLQRQFRIRLALT